MEATNQEIREATSSVVAKEEAEAAAVVEEESEWRDWSSLTKDLLLSVVSFLVTLADSSSFGAVCRSWSSTSSVVSRQTMSSQSPLFVVSGREKRKYFFDATHQRIYKSPRVPWSPPTCRIFGYTHGHLVTAMPNRSLFFLVNFLTAERIMLPPIGKFYPKHLLLSSSPSSPGCIAVLVRKGLNSFLYCRVGDPNWTMYHLPLPRSVFDILFVGNRLYALARDGSLGFFSFVPDPVFTVLESNSIGVDDNSRWFLAELDGALLAIRFNGRYYDMYLKWEEGCRGFSKISSLGEKALFFAGKRFAGSLTASVRSGLAGNSIYVIDGSDFEVYSADTKRRINSFNKFSEYHMKPFWILPSLY